MLRIRPLLSSAPCLSMLLPDNDSRPLSLSTTTTTVSLVPGAIVIIGVSDGGAVVCRSAAGLFRPL
jgi:hypothetical protein